MRLSRSTVAVAILTLVLLASCGDGGKNPSGPGSDLIGTWRFESTDFYDILGDGLVDQLIEQGATRTEARLAVDIALLEVEEDAEQIRSTLRFNANKTWEDDDGGGGTWSVQGNELTMIDEDGDIVQVAYFQDGDELTLIWTGEELLREFAEDDDFTDEDQELYEALIDSDEVIRVFFMRR